VFAACCGFALQDTCDDGWHTHRPDAPEESKRFENKARELGVDEPGKLFSKAMTIVKPPPITKKTRHLGNEVAGKVLLKPF
jgi:hypothetical protein